MKIKNLITAVFLLLAVFIVGCNNSNPPITQYIHAKVENATEFDNIVEVRLMVFNGYDTVRWDNGSWIIERDVELARGEWKDGGFTIELPKTLASRHLRPLVGDRDANYPTNISAIPPTMTISNRNVRVADARFVGIDIDGNMIATFSPFKLDENGDTEALFTYVGSGVTISGYTKRGVHVNPSEGSPAWADIITTYSIKWKKGWNIWHLSRSSTIDNDRFIIISTTQWSSSPVSGLKWHGRKGYIPSVQN